MMKPRYQHRHQFLPLVEGSLSAMASLLCDIISEVAFSFLSKSDVNDSDESGWV